MTTGNQNIGERHKRGLKDYEKVKQRHLELPKNVNITEVIGENEVQTLDNLADIRLFSF